MNCQTAHHCQWSLLGAETTSLMTGATPFYPLGKLFFTSWVESVDTERAGSDHLTPADGLHVHPLISSKCGLTIHCQNSQSDYDTVITHLDGTRDRAFPLTQGCVPRLSLPTCQAVLRTAEIESKPHYSEPAIGSGSVSMGYIVVQGQCVTSSTIQH